MSAAKLSVRSPVLLEQLYDITNDGYSTGSERFDGFIIGLATMLLIRNAELVIINLLTVFFGDRNHKVAYRVLRTWQMLNLNSIVPLISGFDSDIPCSRFQFLSLLSGSRRGRRRCRFKVSKGRFASALFLAVLFGKLLVLTAEVAIIAFVIPKATLHTDPGGLSLVWRDANISERDLRSLETCHFMTDSRFLSDFAQLSLCKRVSVRAGVEVVPQSWASNDTLRMERVLITPEVSSTAGATLLEGVDISCFQRDELNSSVLKEKHRQSVVDRQGSFSSTPDVTLTNDVLAGELVVRGSAVVMSTDGLFYNGQGGMTPIFTNLRGMLRLAFADWVDMDINNASTLVPTVNGKLLWGPYSRLLGSTDFEFCPAAIDEIIRVTGTLHPEVILDILRLSTTVIRSDNFSLPTANAADTPIVRGFDLGVSRKFPIEPKWIMLTAGITVLLSVVTGYLNHTEAVMARVYREQNAMRSACSPVFLEEEGYVEAVLFKNNLKYHWGKKPDDEWTEVEDMDFTEDAVLT